MNDALRLILLLVIAALALTGVGALVARSLDPARRLTRYLRMALGAEPEGVMMDRGGGRAMAFNLNAGKIAVLWDKGRKGLVYKLDQLLGAEMMVDNIVLARCFRDRPVMPLDEIPMAAHRGVMRVVFDNPRDPEYELELWPAMNGRGHEHRSPADAVQAGRKWLTRLESILRRPAPRTLTRPAAPAPILPDEDDPPPWDDEEEEIED
ncbi:MAG TPA: hypothetical protein VGM25_08420 [Caulobacteraceae bacterium]|jgi:hypothetical protein